MPKIKRNKTGKGETYFCGGLVCLVYLCQNTFVLFCVMFVKLAQTGRNQFVLSS